MITITNEDCMDLMRRYPDKYFDLAIVDPPYFNGPNKLNYYGKGFSNLGIKHNNYKKIGSWDLPDKKYFNEIKRISKNQIIWGANYFSFICQIFKIPKGNKIYDFIKNYPIGWIIWDKLNTKPSFNDYELAWTSFTFPTILYKFMWNGMLQGKSVFDGHISQGNKKLNEIRIHPTQKPIALYKWLLLNYAKPGNKILDTHLGSGSIAIACHDLGYDLIACELDTDYYNAALNRLKEHQKQLPLFLPEQIYKYNQDNLFQEI